MKVLCVLLFVFVLLGCSIQEHAQLKNSLSKSKGKDVTIYPESRLFQLIEVGPDCIVLRAVRAEALLEGKDPIYEIFIPYHSIGKVRVWEHVTEIYHR